MRVSHQYEAMSVSAIINVCGDLFRCHGGGQSCGTLWYRGVGSVGYALQPSVYRGQFDGEERNLVIDFMARARPCASADVPGSAEHGHWLCLMQHCGLPTRLLDWSESLLVATFFA